MIELNSETQPNNEPRANEIFFIESGSPSWRLTIRSPLWRPPTDVYETEESLVVRVEIAGMRDQDFSIELIGRILSIRGVRPDATSRRAYHQMEIRFGEFSIELELPLPVVSEQVEAVYNNGFLWITLPIARPRNIPVEDNGT